MKNYCVYLVKIAAVVLLSFCTVHACVDENNRKALESFSRKHSLPIYTFNVLECDLSDENVAAMQVQYEAAQAVEKLGRNRIALGIYWELSMKGYGPANNRLSDIFHNSELGIAHNTTLAIVFGRSPRTMRDMFWKQQDALDCREWVAIRRLEIEQEEAAARREQAAAAADSVSHDEVGITFDERASLLGRTGKFGADGRPKVKVH